MSSPSLELEGWIIKRVFVYRDQKAGQDTVGLGQKEMTKEQDNEGV